MYIRLMQVRTVMCRGFTQQPCCMLGTMKIFCIYLERIYCSCHVTWLQCKTSILQNNNSKYAGLSIIWYLHIICYMRAGMQKMISGNVNIKTIRKLALIWNKVRFCQLMNIYNLLMLNTYNPGQNISVQFSVSRHATIVSKRNKFAPLPTPGECCFTLTAQVCISCVLANNIAIGGGVRSFNLWQ